MPDKIFSTEECAWAQTSMRFLGRTITGIRGFRFKEGVEKEHLYAAGDEPIDIQTGNIKPEGDLTLLKYEVDMLNEAAQAAGYASILRVPHTAIVITCNFKKNANSPTRTITTSGVGFTDMEFAMSQNAKMTEVPLPFLAMKVSVS